MIGDRNGFRLHNVFRLKPGTTNRTAYSKGSPIESREPVSGPLFPNEACCPKASQRNNDETGDLVKAVYLIPFAPENS